MNSTFESKAATYTHEKSMDPVSVIDDVVQPDYSEIVRLLIEEGAEVLAMDNDGNTPLHIALLHRPELVEEGPDIDAVYDFDGSIIDVAVKATLNERDFLHCVQ